MFKENNYEGDIYKHFRLVKTGEKYVQSVNKSNSKASTRSREVVNRVELPFDHVESVNLDVVGEHIPQNETDFTLVSNYLLDYWSPILGIEVVSTYLLLKRYAYGRKDYCFPDIETLCYKLKKTRPTINKYLNILEENGFILIFYRYNTKTSQDATPLFKIRRYVPVISQEMYEALPDSLKESHDELLEEVKGVRMLSQVERFDIDSVVQEGKVMPVKRVRDNAVQPELPVNEEDIAYENIAFNMDEKDFGVTNLILRGMQDSAEVSKPAYDTFFKRCLFILDDSRLLVISPSIVESMHVVSRYSRAIEEILLESGYSTDKLMFESYDSIGFVKAFMNEEAVRESK